MPRITNFVKQISFYALVVAIVLFSVFPQVAVLSGMFELIRWTHFSQRMNDR